MSDLQLIAVADLAMIGAWARVNCKFAVDLPRGHLFQQCPTLNCLLWRSHKGLCWIGGAVHLRRRTQVAFRLAASFLLVSCVVEQILGEAGDATFRALSPYAWGLQAPSGLLLFLFASGDPA